MPCEVTGMKYTTGCKCSFCSDHRVYQRTRYRNKSKNDKEVLCRRISRRLTEVRTENKTTLLNQLGGRCAVCGFQPIDMRQIDIHEINGQHYIGHPFSNSKCKFHPMPSKELGKRVGLERLQKRIHELVPLCRNCHILVHTPKHREATEKKIDDWRRKIK